MIELVKGKKYNIPNYSNNPYIYIDKKLIADIDRFLSLDDKENYTILGKDKYRYIFLSLNGYVLPLSKEEIKPIEEYHEPVEIIIDGWIVYATKQKPTTSLLDRLTGLYTVGNYIYKTEEEASYIQCNGIDRKIKKIQLTVRL